MMPRGLTLEIRHRFHSRHFSRLAAYRGDERRFECSVPKPKSQRFRLGWNDALGKEEDVCHLAEHETQRKGRCRHEGRAPEDTSERHSEFAIRHRRRRSKVDRSNDLVLLQHVLDDSQPIVAMDPGPVPLVLCGSVLQIGFGRRDALALSSTYSFRFTCQANG
jgi:hypothetical protein